MSEKLIYTWRGRHPSTLYLHGEKVGTIESEAMTQRLCMTLNLLAEIPAEDIAQFAEGYWIGRRCPDCHAAPPDYENFPGQYDDMGRCEAAPYELCHTCGWHGGGK